MISTGSGYFLYLDDGTDLRLAKGSSAAGLTQIGSFPYEHEQGIYYNLVLSANGSALKGKVWSDAESEPGWQIEETDASYASGAPGQVSIGGATVDFDVFAAGLGGDPYPTSRDPGAPTWLTPAVPIAVTPGEILHLSWAQPAMASLVMGGEVRYILEFQRNGDGAWTGITITTDLFWDWNTENINEGTDYCVRVAAIVGCEQGPWAEICGIGLPGSLPGKDSPDGYFFGDWSTGQPDLGQWIRKFEASHMDDDTPVTACWVTREFMPSGVGGEAVFNGVYPSITATTAGYILITPILDGDRLDDEQRYIQFNPSGELRSRRYEIDLTAGYSRSGIERFRHGLRGTYIQFEICAVDTGGTGRIELDGLAIKYLPARETHTWARPFIGELETDVEQEKETRFFFGTATEDGLDAGIYEIENGSFDFGSRLRFWMESRPWAPGGPGSEVSFGNLYICVTRSNEAATSIDITPILDSTELETATKTLAGTDFPMTEVLEIPISVPYDSGSGEVLRHSARGVWFSFRVTNTGERPDGDFIINGAAVQMQVDRESQGGS